MKSKENKTAATGPLLAPIRPELDKAEQEAKRTASLVEVDAWIRYRTHNAPRLAKVSGPLFDEQKELF